MKPREKPDGRKHEGWISGRNGSDEGIQYAHFKHKGKFYRESSNSPHVRDARRLLDRMRREILAGTYLPPKERARLERERLEREQADARARELGTVANLVDRWLSTYVPTARNEKGQRLAATRARTYFVPFLGERRAAEVTREDLRAYRLHLQGLMAPAKEGEEEERRLLTDQTVGHILSEARSFFSWAAEENHIPHSPIPRKLLPKVPEQEPKALTDAEAETLAGMPGALGLACRVMLGTGVRWGELVTLKSTDVRDGALVLTAPKTGKKRRIPLRPALLAEIRQHVGKLVPWTTAPKDYHVFLKAARKHSGLETFGAHQCRHTFAFRWIWNGGSLSALQLILGHADIATTTIYAKPTDALARREAERMWAQEAAS